MSASTDARSRSQLLITGPHVVEANEYVFVPGYLIFVQMNGSALPAVWSS